MDIQEVVTMDILGKSFLIGYHVSISESMPGLLFESGDFLLQRKMQFGHILETFKNFNKRKTLVGPQVIPLRVSIKR